MPFSPDALLDRLPAALAGNPWLRAAVLMAAAAVLAKLSDLVITRGIALWVRRSRTDLDDRLIALLHRPIFVSVLLAGLWLATRQLELPERLSGVVLDSLVTVLVLVWLGFGFRASALLVEALGRLGGPDSPRIEPRTLSLLDKTAKLGLLGVATYFVFLAWGINVGGLLVSGGIVGLALGFAAKDTLANLFSGIFILADAPYQTGDYIVLDSGERGEVTHIGLRSTRLLTRDDVEVTIPNAVIANAKIVNESGGRWTRERIRVKVEVAYGSDVDRVRQVLLEVAAEQPDLQPEPEPRVRFRAFGESGLSFELLGWIAEPMLRGRVLDDLNTRVYKRLTTERIEIPYPKRDLYVRELPAAESR